MGTPCACQSNVVALAPDKSASVPGDGEPTALRTDLFQTRQQFAVS